MLCSTAIRKLMTAAIESMKDVRDTEILRITQVPIMTWIVGIAVIGALSVSVVLLGVA